MKPLVVGQAPSRLSDPREPLSGRSGARLAALCGLDFPAFLTRFDRVNLIDAYPEKLGKGDAFDRVAARFAACNLTGRLGKRRTVLLGRAVARAFHFTAEPLAWIDEIGDGALVALCPHPSSVSLWWNDPANVESARKFWRALAAESGP